LYKTIGRYHNTTKKNTDALNDAGMDVGPQKNMYKYVYVDVPSPKSRARS
jgi:hypothetical protein